jgi:hypothetical protein
MGQAFSSETISQTLRTAGGLMAGVVFINGALVILQDPQYYIKIFGIIFGATFCVLAVYNTAGGGSRPLF